jgi:hypothetical protein
MRFGFLTVHQGGEGEGGTAAYQGRGHMLTSNAASRSERLSALAFGSPLNGLRKRGIEGMSDLFP